MEAYGPVEACYIYYSRVREKNRQFTGGICILPGLLIYAD